MVYLIFLFYGKILVQIMFLDGKIYSIIFSRRILDKKRILKTNKIVLAFCTALFMIFSFIMVSGCDRQTQLSNVAIIHEEEFGGVYIKNTIEEFNALGFNYGDSVDITFSNGFTLKDIPYYNGYYTQNGEELLVAYTLAIHILKWQ